LKIAKVFKKGGETMKGFAKGTKKGQKGFTLVELLIVFTLLSVLAAIMIPNISGLVAYGHDSAAAAELSVIQTAMDTMMARLNITAVTPVLAAEATANMSNFTVGHKLYPGYLRFEKAAGNYTCDATGLVHQTLTGY
jgi:prepilin-type N-terminal cleavage/methylation domain-containing protein